MAIAEGKQFKFDSESKIDSKALESFPYSGLAQTINYETNEFSAVCPFSGLPDIATVTIEYVPTDKIVELKSLKYYFMSFRSVGIYQEAATDRIYKDLKNILNPHSLKIKTVYNIRGGILATCTLDSEILEKYIK